MNIREVERELGIPRANIRYYEKEGLLHPARGANNYRIYTEEDVAALEKIRLLRRLDMPVETIRAVQAGKVALAEALARQERLLESEAVKLERARAVCRSMLADGATYPALDPGRYEAGPFSLEAAAPPEPSRPPVEGAEWAFDPWQRFWARTFDLSLWGGLAGVVLAVRFRISVVNTEPALAQFLEALLGWGLTLVVEPLLLCTWGTTPGKWLLGLELRDSRGGKPGFFQALRRTWGVLWTGYGLHIPGYSLFRQYRCYKTCRENQLLDYDYEEEFLYYSKVRGRWGGRAAAAVVLSLLLLPGEVWCAFQAVVPPHRGEITAADFAENVNAVADGRLWVNEEGFRLSDQTMDVRYNGGPWEERRYGEPYEDAPVYTLEQDEDGFVRGVRMEQAGGGAGGEGEWVWLPTADAQVVAAAFRGAWCSGYEMLRSPIQETLAGDARAWDVRPVRDGEFQLAVALEQEGYSIAGSGGDVLLIPEEDAETRWYRFALRLEKGVDR